MSSEHRQIEHTAATWLARRDAGDWSDDDESALQAWLSERPAHRVAFLRLEAAWNGAARLKTMATGSFGARIPARGEWAQSPYFAGAMGEDPGAGGAARLHARNPRQPRRRRWSIGMAVAATLLVAAVLVGNAWWRDANHVDRGAWGTALGAQEVVHLADGSNVTLGGDTELHAALSRHQRDLYLSRGEALFDVAHDRARPFVVHVGAYRVTALGTRFDVRRDPAGLRVVVTRGVVRLQATHGSDLALTDLPAGSVALVANGIVSTHAVPLDAAREYLSWRDGYVVFRQTPLAEAIAEFNRYNEQKILLADPSLGQLRIGGNFHLANSSAFVRLIQQVFPIRAEARAGDVVLSRRHPASRH
ncbi:MAG TPA: FecR domain-containing protein [Rhodanobacteraceae bacterium]|nr:FecR domain-containing protein [Rhodanobacteraceae bacterium]